MNTYSKKIDKKDFNKIKQFFEEKNWTFSQMQYAVFQATKDGIKAVLYNSGKILIQGKQVEKIVQELFEENASPIQNLTEDKKINHNFSSWIGTDESGKGDYFGPLVIASVLVDEKNQEFLGSLGIKDSKKLSDNVIKKLAAQIKNNATFSIVKINPLKYNELYSKFKNLNKLLAWGHARAIENILEKADCKYAISDKFGDESLIKNALMEKGKQIELLQETKAECDLAVAAASVIARAEFCKLIQELADKYSIPFTKGISQKTIQAGHDFVEKYGKSKLIEVAKLHFKTTNVL